MQIDDAIKRKYLNDHFPYEVYELVGARSFHNNLPANNQFIKNMSIEHSCLHARNLYEFYFDNPDSSKLVAKDYNANWAASKDTKNLKDFAKRVNNEVSHLGFLRYTDAKDKGWDIIGLIDEILVLTKRFLTDLDPKYQDTEIIKLKADLERLPPD